MPKYRHIFIVYKKKKHLNHRYKVILGVFFFWYGERDTHITVSASSSRRPFESHMANQKRVIPDGITRFWYGERDSNPRPTDS